jgi:hypothetical protein
MLIKTSPADGRHVELSWKLPSAEGTRVGSPLGDKGSLELGRSEKDLTLEVYKI